MTKKISGRKRVPGDGAGRKQLQSKRLRLKRLHRDASKERAELERVSPDQLPPASSSNAARQVRSRLNITFPVDWQDLHLNKSSEAEKDADAEKKSDDSVG